MKRLTAQSTTVFVFAVALAVSNVALPLAALEAGYSGGQIGLFAGLSGIAQLVSRPAMPWMALKVSDKVIVAFAAACLAAACGAVAVSFAAFAFIGAHVAQGIARALFWSGNQLHAVRSQGASVPALAKINLFSGIGAFVGPVVAGQLSEVSTPLALAVGAGLAATAGLVASRMQRLPVLAARTTGARGGLHKRSGILAACLASGSAGIWGGLLASYVPVVLAREQSAGVVGALIAVANVGNMLSSVAIGHHRVQNAQRWLRPSAVAGGLGLGLVGAASSSVVLAGLLLLIAGFGCGSLITLGPALATDAVPPDERARAITLTGTFRAVAMFAAPVGVAAQLAIAPLSLAMFAMGSVIMLTAAKRYE